MPSQSLSRWDWLLLSVALATLSGLFHWFVHHLATTSKVDPAEPTFWRRLQRILESPWFVQPARLIYAVGMPALALLWQGALTSRGLGLKPFPIGAAAQQPLPGQSPIVPTSGATGWIRDLGWFAVVAAATTAVVLLGNRSAHRVPETGAASRGRRNLAQAAIDAIVYEVHWSFYREPFVVTWGLALGSWLGTVPVLVETAVNLMFWERLRAGDAGYVRMMLVRAGLLAASTQLYLRTQNLWLAILMDLLVGWLCIRSREPQSVTSPAMTTIR